jgi:DNA (cytosine-5)-methyltransferase 1
MTCQDISLAGKGAGIDGERSGLWSEYARLIRELRPRYVIVENVAALLGRGLGTVLGDLAASGYDAEWDCIPAEAIGAPHERDRLYLVAYPHGGGKLQPQGRVGEVGRWAGDVHQEVSDALRGGCGSRRPWRPVRDGQWQHRASPAASQSANADRQGLPIARDARAVGPSTGRILTGAAPDRVDWWATEPNVVRMVHGLPGRVDRIRGLGNAVIPQIPEWIGRRILAVEGGAQ